MALERFEKKTINHQILAGLVEMMNRGRVAHIAPLVHCQRPVLDIALGQMVKSKHLTYNTLSGIYTVTDEALRIHNIKPAGIEQLEGSTMAKIDGKKCTYCEKTKDPSEFYTSQQRCKICFTGLAKVSKLRKEGKPIPADLMRFTSGTAAFGSTPVVTKASQEKAAEISNPAVPKQSASTAAVATPDSPFRIVPETITECRVVGSGAEAEAMITQAGRVHLYRLKELQQLRDWASIVLKREMSA